MGAEAWISEESRMVAVALRAVVRALRRPVLVLSVTLLATAALLAVRVTRPPMYLATAYFRLAEGELGNPDTAPRPPRAIREYVSDVALSRTRLEQVMLKYGLSAALVKRDRVAAIDAFREDIGLEVTRNYFIYDRRPDDPPRSAQITLSLWGSDPGRTRAILHEIGDALLQEQTARRSNRLAHARELVGAQLQRARSRVRSIEEAIGGELGHASSGTERAIGARARVAALNAELQGAVEQMLALERRSAEVSFSTAAEGENLGLNLELYDESLVASSPRLGPLQLAGLGALVFALVLLLVLPVVGSFDDRVYGPDDLEARGLPYLGALPRFAGDDVGAFHARHRPDV